MAGVIDNFFLAWGAPEDQRDAMIREAVAEDVSYADPRGNVDGVQALCGYVAQYTASAPGAAAEVAEETKAGEVRVRFYGDGWEQFGRYQVTLNDAGRIARIAGIVEIT